VRWNGYGELHRLEIVYRADSVAAPRKPRNRLLNAAVGQQFLAVLIS
jgi:hypothetical protein